MVAIEASSLSKTYSNGISRKRRVEALSGFSLCVESGQIFSLLGPNGAGKTTFIKILLSLTRPTSGSASILNVPLPDDAVKGRVGYLPENHRYPGYFTGPQVLRFFGGLSGVQRPRLEERLSPLLELVGMAQWRDMKVKKYSKGMLQRLGLAQALINDPEVLFLDEPTDGVDPVGRKEIREILRDLKRQGKTIFLNSHLLSEVELISDRVAILDKGKLLRVGTVDELTGAGGSRYLIGISGHLPEEAQTEAQATVIRLETAGETVTAECSTPTELNRVIDLLRRHGVEITSIARQRSTLEDSFLSLIKREVAQ
ncbi:MAG: ABC transporter ATP-binding protein [Bacteroidota bacterium]